MRIRMTVSLIFSCFAFSVSAQSVDDLIKRATEVKSDISCLIPPALVGDLVQRLSEDVTRQDSSKILSFLASQPYWRSDDHLSALRRLNSLSQQSDILTVSLVARALEKADGELLDILSNEGSFVEISDALDSLIRKNEERNPVYANFAKLARAELLQERAFQQIVGSSLPLIVTDETSSSRDLLIEAIGIYSEASEDFSTLRTTEGFGSRDYELDLPYLISLLRFVAGDENWAGALRDMLEVEGKSDAYDTRTNGRHILVERFLKPSRATPIDDGGGCKTKETVLEKTQDLYGRDRVWRFFNPVQLANYTCNILGEGRRFEGLEAVVNDLEKFENRDYRVVLGHYRGKEIRFSFLSKSELVKLAKEFSAEIDIALSEVVPSQFSSPCSEGLVEPMIRSASFIGIQETGQDAGYIYVGSGLALDEAERLQRLITANKIFRDAYLIRPVID